MFRNVIALALLLAARPAAAQSPVACDPSALASAAATARDNVIDAVDGSGAIDAWNSVMSRGGVVAWSVTEYNVDVFSTFVLAFDRTALRVYRTGAIGDGLDRAMSGCIDAGVRPEAIIPWEDVKEIEAGNWVVWFKLRKAVTIRSDRGKQHDVKELKVYFHGAGTGELTFEQDFRTDGVESYRGVAVGPTDFQRRLQFVLASVVDPDKRIAVPRKGRGAGW